MLVLLNCNLMRMAGNNKYTLLDRFITKSIVSFLNNKYIDVDYVEALLYVLDLKYKLYINDEDNGLLYRGAVMLIYDFDY